MLRLTNPPYAYIVGTGIPGGYAGDWYGATSFLLVFVHHHAIAAHLTQEGPDPVVEELAESMPAFNIAIDHGQPQPHIDAALIRDSRLPNLRKRKFALMSALYNILCNIIHGEKNFDQYQDMLLNPCILESLYPAPSGNHTGCACPC